MTIRDQIVAYAQAQEGKPYAWGATGPSSFDCSGLVYAAERAAGLNVSRATSIVEVQRGTQVARAQAAPGDLVYANGPAAAAGKDAYVDREARKGKGPSDHAPVVVDLDL